MNNERFELTKLDKETALWKKLKAHYEQRLDVLRKNNDTDLSDIETARLRGRIGFAKEFLGLDAPDITTLDR